LFSTLIGTLFVLQSRYLLGLLSLGLGARARAEAGGGLTVASVLSRSDMDDVGVNSARDAVLGLDVELGDLVAGNSGHILNISLGGSINHVSDHKTLNSLVLCKLKSTSVNTNEGCFAGCRKDELATRL
jgi:hypothetical protein